MKNKGTQFLTEAAVIGAIYVVLTLLFAPLSYGEIQIRFSEALTILPFFTPAANHSNKQKGTNHLCKSARLKAPPMVGRLQYSQTLQSINRS